MGKGFRKFAGTLTAAIAVVSACAPTASADSGTPTWNCRASTAYLVNHLLPLPGLGLVLPDPIVANGNPDPDHPDNAQCATDTPILHHINVGGDGGLLDADAAAANTTLNPEIAPARDQTAFSAANLENVALRLGSAPAQIVVKIATMGSQASARCFGGVPLLQGSSTAAHIEINGNLLPIDDGLTQLAEALAPLAPLVKIEVNKQTITGDADTDTQTLLQQALVIKLLNTGTDDTALTLVLGEAKVARQGRTCDGDNLPGAPNPPQLQPLNPPATSPGPSGPTSPSVVFVPVQVPVDTGSGGTKTSTVELNGTNGGCGTVKMFFDKNKSKADRTFNSTFGQRVVTRGRLISCSGKNIVGGRVDVYHLIRGQKHRIRKTGVRSRPGGLVTLILPLNLTSRKIFYEYRGNLASSKVNSRSTLTLNVYYKGKIISKLPPGQPKPRF